MNICGRKFALTSFPIWESALFGESCKTSSLIQGTGLLYLCAEDALKQGLVFLLETQLLSMYGKCKGGPFTVAECLASRATTLPPMGEGEGEAEGSPEEQAWILGCGASERRRGFDGWSSEGEGEGRVGAALFSDGIGRTVSEDLGVLGREGECGVEDLGETTVAPATTLLGTRP